MWLQVNLERLTEVSDMSLQGLSQVQGLSKKGALRKLSATYTSGVSLSHPIWLPCPGEMYSEQRPIFFPITAAVQVKWPICLLRRTGHARLVGMSGSEDGDKEGGFYNHANAPSGYTERTVKFCFCQLASHSSYHLQSLLKIKVWLTAKAKNRWWAWKCYKERHEGIEV